PHRPDAHLFPYTPLFRSWNRINVITAGKQPQPQWLTAEGAERHCEAGAGIWEWACTCPAGEEPDLVMACCGDVPTLETLAAVDLLRSELPDLRIRVVNVVDLMTLQSHEVHPHGFTDDEFDALFTRDRTVIFAYHGYPYLIHRLAYKRTNHVNLHVHGFQEEGTTTTPFDMAVMNGIDRFHLAMAAVRRLPELGMAGEKVIEKCRHSLEEHSRHVREHGEDMHEIQNWSWPYKTAAEAG